MRVYSAPILASVSQIRHVLEMNGIECEIRGEFRSGGAGEIPPTEAWPELWVVDPAQEAQAIAIVEDALKEVSEGEAGAPWRCGYCGESVEAVFAACWNCGQAEPRDG